MNYYESVRRAIRFIEENLKAQITLKDVAEQVGFSMYHFHRIFRAMIGESITDYIRKRRLTEVAHHLVETERRMIDLAFDYQYQSQEAFVRAFKRMYNMTPGRYRKLQQHFILVQRKRITESDLKHLQRGITMEPKIVNLESFLVVGMEYYGANQNGEIPALWSQFNQRAQEIQHRTRPNTYLGVCSPVENMTNESEFSYIACVEVSEDDEIPIGMVAKKVPACKYAVFTHKGSTEQLGETYQYIHGTWIPSSGVELVMAPDFELYDQRFKPGDDDSEMDIYIPIK